MTDALLQSYLPLFAWTGLGLIFSGSLPASLPRLLGRSLYWVGVPLEILALARQTNFAAEVGLAPLLIIATLLSGFTIAWLVLQAMQSRLEFQSVAAGLTAENCSAVQPFCPAERGSFLIASVLGNTSFVGLAIAPAFVGADYWGWLVSYCVTQNVIGTYGTGVFLASYYGRQADHPQVKELIKDVLTVPSLWAFLLGYSTQSIPLPAIMESGLHGSIAFVIPAALLLMGTRLRQLQGWKSLKIAIVPMLLKTIALPGLLGLVTHFLALPQPAQLALVLMAGMPSAFAGLILAEEYEIDRSLIASSIVLTTGSCFLLIPLWLWLFG
ncbi:AEC family transporter [Leptolyngbya sp. FACHB-711]|uniref:AEC family transporter n=1 Tax=Leptolyngbya sp. FACHB-711 TaxID=2692813 RepID=UPI001686BB1E|nr:AEC family transporter [Leptolyngbya sp. FACHB-711]MBD2023154.1 AEC family transporter [Leptolyngbya sp. FACHB-711]